MENSNDQKSQQQNTQVKVDNLPKPARSIPEQEAELVKGGGGAYGGVLRGGDSLGIGEEIPQ